MKTEISNQMVGQYLNEAVDKVVSTLRSGGMPVQKREGIVMDLIYFSQSPDGLGDISRPRAVLHITKTVKSKIKRSKWQELLFGPGRNLEQSVAMFEHAGDKVWDVHIVPEILGKFKTAIMPAMKEFSNRTGFIYSQVLEPSIPYKQPSYLESRGW